ncbi:MAG TPA: hypothetical protein VEO00_12375, partial [Actinomycetota bacterium]|nr:hypothetical protein [Actinomycetota bacterium]
EVTDSGAPFDPDTYEGEPAAVDGEEFSFERGLSLPVVRGLVEDLEIVARAEGGMRVRFTLRAG